MAGLIIRRVVRALFLLGSGLGRSFTRFGSRLFPFLVTAVIGAANILH
jgi:hypothetical protein